jgi:hypothetical protein
VNGEPVGLEEAFSVPGGPQADALLEASVESIEWDRSDAIIDEWGRQSFPASDPPSNW